MALGNVLSLKDEDDLAVDEDEQARKLYTVGTFCVPSGWWLHSQNMPPY